MPKYKLSKFNLEIKPVEGVTTSTVGFIGETQFGPAEPHLITNWQEYQQIFGSFFGETKYLPYTVKGFFDNSGQRCYISRINPNAPGISGYNESLNNLSQIDDISIVYSPNSQGIDGLTDLIITNCETLKDRFAIIDCKPNQANINRLEIDLPYTQYAAVYYPWLKIKYPSSGKILTIPPGGHIAGIYALVDKEKGVHRAPANEELIGVEDLQFQITKGQQETLNPLGINVIRKFTGKGILVWGARTLSHDTSWKYINVKRLLIFLEKSINKGIKWVKLEPNNENLWDRVRSLITQFLTIVWRNGAFMGKISQEAFFVKCDRTTMTQNDIDNGKLIVMIGVAPLKPAEFIIFRISQWTANTKAFQ